MIATGPKPPLSFNSSNDEAPIKLDIGGGMGKLRNVDPRPEQFVLCACVYPCRQEYSFIRQLDFCLPPGAAWIRAG